MSVFQINKCHSVSMIHWHNYKIKKVDFSESPDLNIIENLWAYIQDELWKIYDKLKIEMIWGEKLKKFGIDNLLQIPKTPPKVLIKKGKRINH